MRGIAAGMSPEEIAGLRALFQVGGVCYDLSVLDLEVAGLRALFQAGGGFKGLALETG